MRLQVHTGLAPMAAAAAAATAGAAAQSMAMLRGPSNRRVRRQLVAGCCCPRCLAAAAAARHRCRPRKGLPCRRWPATEAWEWPGLLRCQALQMQQLGLA